MSQAALVACNIYVSAGRPCYKDLLLNLLKDAQKHARFLRKTEKQKIAIVHAFSDGPYDRSSFHLAGQSSSVAKVASMLAIDAVEALATCSPKSTDALEHTSGHQHPTVGLVDHVAVMPLSESDDLPIPQHDDAFVPSTPHGQAARIIGEALSIQAGVNTLFYGNAHPEGTPLAKIRREKTRFFQTHEKNEGETPLMRGICTVGAPPNFVENFNIRLKAGCNKSLASSLTKRLRERDGGLPGVEALTLPYGTDQYEVACNLLQPSLIGASFLLAMLQEWVQDSCDRPWDQVVDKTYRVGTTAQQCLRVLDVSEQEDHMEQHDKIVTDRLLQFLS